MNKIKDFIKDNFRKIKLYIKDNLNKENISNLIKKEKLLKKKNIIVASCCIGVSALVLIANSSKILEQEIVNEPIPMVLTANKDEIKEENVFDSFLSSIENTNKIKTSKIFSQTKYLSELNEENKRDELLKYSISANYDGKEDKNLRGFFTFEMPIFSINIRFPIMVNKLTTDAYKVYVDIPNSYKPTFNMTDKERYLFFDKLSIDSILKEYELVKEDNKKTIIESESLEEVSNISCENLNESSKLYKFNFNRGETITLYDKLKNDDTVVGFVIKGLLKRDEVLATIESFKGEAGVTDGVLTDIYFEILLEDGSLIVNRLTFENINDGTISVENFEDSSIKNVKDFIKSLDTSLNFSTLNQAEHVITINDIFFTGEDETKILNFEEPIENLSIINIFINFVDCTPQTRLVIKWFYEDQEVPLIETKISNGDFIEGVLKSSISFEDENQIQKGKYNIKVYIDGQETAVYENTFEIK